MLPRRRLAVTLLAPIPWAVLLFQLLLIVPRHAKLLNEFNIHSEGLTHWVLTASKWVTNHLLLAFVATVLGMGMSVALAQSGSSERWSRRARLSALGVAFGLPLVLFGLAWLGVDGSQRRLDEGLSK